MDFEMTCDVCCVEFNDSSVIPKMLNCGHSLCLSCIWKLIESNPYCPKCRNALDKNKAADNYPTNYALLDASDILRSVKISEVDLSSSVKEMKTHIISQRENLIQKRSQISLELNQIEDDLAQLLDLIDPMEKEVLNYKKARLVLDTLEKRYNKAKDFAFTNFVRLRCSVDINLSNFSTASAYLTEIYSRLQKAERIYAVKNIDDVVKYGQISIQNNAILFHALSETNKPDHSTIIWFDELKQCVTQENFFTFLKLTCNEQGAIHLVTFKMLDTQLSSLFITLCTGECGPSYKGCFYEKHDVQKYWIKGIFKLEYSKYEISLPNKRIDYITKTENNHKNRENEINVSLRADGSFLVSRMLNHSAVKNSAGKLQHPTNIDEYISFKDASKLKILDCGILILL